MAEPAITQERLDELKDVLSRIPGSDRKPWVLEVWDLRDGVETLTKSIDIRSGRAVTRRKRKSSNS